MGQIQSVKIKRNTHERLIWNECSEAIQEGNIERPMELLNHSTMNVNLHNHLNSSLLLNAANGGHIDIVKLLVEKGANVNHHDNEGKTALLNAANGGHIDIVKLLVMKGANANHQNKWGKTALLNAAEGGYIDIVKLLMEKGANVSHQNNYGNTALLNAIEGDHIDIVKLLTEKRVKVNHRNKWEGAALLNAAERGHIDIVKLLLAKYPSIYAYDSEGLTALMYAAQGGHIEIVKLLLTKGADVNRHDRSGRTALLYAAQRGHIEILQLLLVEDVRIDHQDDWQRTALVYATQGGHIKIVQLLLTKGAKVDHHDEDRRTALLYAAQRGHIEIVQLLLAKGAKVDHQDIFRRTVLLYAAEGGHIEITQLLLAKGAKLDHDRSRRTANAHVDATDDANIDSPSHQTRMEHQLLPRDNFSVEWFIHPSKVEYDGSRKTLNGGFFASVHYGKWIGAPVAVKMLISSDKNMLDLFYQEVNTWYRLNHPHVVKLYGAWDIGNPAFVCEHPTNGSLGDYLKNPSNKPKIWKKLYEAALGLQYLHERNIVHDNLKFSNILIGGDEVAKLTGFGRSFNSKCAKTNHGENLFTRANWNWKAPECFEDEPPTFASDVYSLGMCVLEVVSEKIPWSGYSDWDIRENVTSGILPYEADNYYKQEWKLVERMCALKPKKRPKISDVVRELHKFANQEALSTIGIASNNEDKSKSVVRVNKYCVRECNNTLIKDVLSNILEACY